MATKSKSKKTRGTTIRVSGPETFDGETLYGIYEAMLLELQYCSCDSWQGTCDQDVWNALAEEVNKRAGL